MPILDEIATLIAGATVAGLPGTAASTASGWLMFKSHLPDSTAIPNKCIGLIEEIGQGVMGRVEMEMPGLSVVIRGEPANSTESTPYATAQAKMTQTRDVLHGYTGSTGTSSVHYAGIWVQNSGFLGFDESWRPLFTIGCRILKATT